MKKYRLFILFISLFVISNKLNAQTHWYLRTGLGAPTNNTSWTDAPTGVGGNTPVAGEFALSNRIWHFRNRATASLFVPWNIHTASTASIEAGINLTSSITGSIQGIVDITSGGTLTISNPNQVNFNFNSLDASSTVVYNNANVRVTTGNYGNLVIAQNSTLTTAASINVNGILDIRTGRTLRLNGNGLYLNGTSGSITGSGTLIGDNLAWITLQGGNGGNNGTLRFAAGSEDLDYLIILYNVGSDYITLGSKLDINLGAVSGLLQITGGIDLNGNDLTIDSGADISFSALASDGVFRGSNTSGLFINGTVGAYLGTTDLFMDPSNNTLEVLMLNSSASLGVGNALNIADSLSVQGSGVFNTNSNVVTLVSTSALKGRLGNMTNGTLNGNLTVQTFARGNTTDWANLGISGIQGQTFNNWYGQIPMAIEGSTTGVTSVANTYFESVQSWFESSDTYDTTLTVTSPITPGKGYWVYLGTALNTTTDMVWSVSGTAVTGNVSIPVTSSGAGWNLISNPYPSPLDWNNVMAVGGNSGLINDAYYIYDAELGSTVSYVSGAATPVSYQPMVDVIPMGQAFYVEAIGAGNLSVTETCKSNKNTSANELLKSSSNSSSVSSLFRLNIDGGGYHDDAVIRFHSNATNSFDKALDARKMYNSPGYVGYPGTWGKRTVIATQSNNEDYSINSLPYAQTQNAVIPVIARVYTTGQYTISGTDIQNLPPNACVILKDKLLNTTQDLRLGNYICNIVDTTIVSRFELTVCADVTADVKSNTAIEAASAITINKDAQGIFVDFDFKNATKANITVTNILGQRIMDTKKVKVTNDNVYLDLNVNDQLIFVTVETENEKVTKKFLNFR